MNKISYLKNEINRQVYLCDDKGLLSKESVGWSRVPLHICNISRPKYRMKKWNYWSISGEKYYFTAAITDMGYIKTAFLYLLDKESNILLETAINTISSKACTLSDEVCGYSRFRTEGNSIDFLYNRSKINIKFNSRTFKGGALKGEFNVEIPCQQQTLNVVVPWNDRKFHFTSKQNCLPVQGSMKVGDKLIDFASHNTLASLDYGRGIWPYNSFWNWASSSGKQQGKRIGFNLGGGWTNGTGSNENAIFIDNEMIKVSEDVIFQYDKNNKMTQWIIKSESNRLYLQFAPEYHRLAENNFLIIKSDLHQIFGSYSGYYILDNGNKLEFNSIYGCVEEHKARW